MHITETFAKNNREVLSIKIKDIVDNNGKTLNHEEINEKFELKFSEWNWMALTFAIPKIWKDKMANEPTLSKLKTLINTNDTYIIINNTAKKMNLTNSKELYKKIIITKISPPSSINKWAEIYPFMEGYDWNRIFLLPYKIIKEPFLQGFQYKVLNRIINCNDKLYTWKIKDNNKCEYCKHIDTLEHHFFWCDQSRDFWIKVQEWSKSNLDTTMTLTVCEILFGICIDDNESFMTLNFLILLGKLFINRSRNNGEPIYYINFLSLLKEKIQNIIYIKE